MPRHGNGADDFLEGDDRRAVAHALDRRGLVRGRALYDLLLLVRRGIADEGVQQEPIFLRLGQRIGSLLVDRILCGQHEEGRFERIGLAAGGDLDLLHRLQQGRLRLGRRAVDLVGQDDVGEDRTGHEDGHAATGGVVLLDDVGARDVGGHQVGGELNPVEREREHAGEGVDHQRLGQAGHSLEQIVTAGEDRDQEFVQHFALADNHLAECRQHAPAAFRKGLDLLFDRFIHGFFRRFTFIS